MNESVLINYKYKIYDLLINHKNNVFHTLKLELYMKDIDQFNIDFLKNKDIINQSFVLYYNGHSDIRGITIYHRFSNEQITISFNEIASARLKKMDINFFHDAIIYLFDFNDDFIKNFKCQVLI